MLSLLAHLCLIVVGWLLSDSHPELRPVIKTIRVTLVDPLPVKVAAPPVVKPQVVPPLPKPVEHQPPLKKPQIKPAKTEKVEPVKVVQKRVARKGTPAPPVVPSVAPSVTMAPSLQVPAEDKSVVVQEPATEVVITEESIVLQARLEEIRNRYLLMLKERIEHHKQYPLMSRKGRQQGTVIVQFELTPEGEVKSCQVKKSCGHRLLDRAALQAVNSASPFPALPQEIDFSDTDFVLPIKFVLTR